jgi:ribonuclease P protein component
VFDKADYKAGSEVLLLLARDNGSDRARIGFVISKKSIKTSVKRNSLRRHLREEFRIRQHDLPAIDIVILTRKNQAKWDVKKIRERFIELLLRITMQFQKRQKLLTNSAEK